MQGVTTLGPDPSQFPDPNLALDDPNGLLAVGGDLSPERILSAYQHGIFPWYEAGQPILWWSPDPRALLYFDKLKISRSLTKRLKKHNYQITFDKNFRGVVQACAQSRTNNGGTWITEDMQHAYLRLHEFGQAHSIEVWADTDLVGGLYGLSIGQVFCGESMFHTKTDASKIAFVSLVKALTAWHYQFIDCQLVNPHLLSLGAVPVRRKQFLEQLSQAIAQQPSLLAWY